MSPPVQVSFHGFPGTMGADFIHYLVADRRTASPDHQVLELCILNRYGARSSFYFITLEPRVE